MAAGVEQFGGRLADAAGFAQIAREAGVSQRTLFRYFGTKRTFSAAIRTGSGKS
ncbi:helix-turn-helix domain-containing protein [Streptomyces malaysiensis]|uniref:helix-turn-helix domain-containing protein n=1 Tax=Streptomyces malaysiensis TaxID=92644 RepID=UPI002B2F7E30|nr:helix-turn-helix domain-containing protein [Streptomyces malaysiensis]